MKLRFTLLEALITIIVLLVIAYFAIVWPERGAMSAAQRARAQADAKMLGMAIQMYYEEYSTFPTVRGGSDVIEILAGRNERKIQYLENSDSLVDPWGASYRFKIMDDAQMRIWSMGPNGEDENGAGDDLVERITIQPLP